MASFVKDKLQTLLDANVKPIEKKKKRETLEADLHATFTALRSYFSDVIWPDYVK
jgi:hypothetical protein